MRYGEVSRALYPTIVANAEHFDRVTTAEHFGDALERLLRSLADEFGPKTQSTEG
jgi:hypothetical protein